jgi:hypothetical protein
MQNVMKISPISAAVAIACLILLAGVDSPAQDEKPTREVYQAQAMGQSTQLGKTFSDHQYRAVLDG